MKPLLENIYAKYPPPHDPRERSWVGRIDQWEVRIFSPHDYATFQFNSKGIRPFTIMASEMESISLNSFMRLTGNLL